MSLTSGYYGYDGYDANGDRVYKLTGESNIRHPNNELSDADIMINDIVLYPNPYVTITPKSYTKHYYAGSERLASSIGQGGWCSMSSDVISETQTEHEYRVQKHWNDMYINEFPFEYYHENPPVLTQNVDIYDGVLSELQYRCPVRHLRQLNISLGNINLLAVMQGLCGPQAQEDVIYYTHGDHLGSANWITDFHGVPVQYIHYLPYGQLLANQAPYGYDERYKFTGKERDAESGYDYFGARFYWSLFKHWTSVDPLVDNYLHISPYAYCNWNPVKFVDPDGKAIHVAAGAIIGAVIGGTISGISAMNDPTKSGRQVMGAIAGGALSGAITGGAAAFTGGLSLGATGTIAFGAISGAAGELAGSAVSQGIGNGEINVGEVVRAGLVGAVAGTVTGAASKGVSEAVKKSGVVQSIQTKMLNGVKSGTGKAAKQQANQTRKSIINFCSPGNDKQFQMKDLITYPADVVGQEVSTGVTTSGAVVDKTQEVQSNVADKLGL